MAEFKKIEDPKNASKEDLKEALELLNKKRERDAKIKSGEIKGGKTWKELSPEAKAKALKQSKRFSMRQRLLIKKAKEAGITVSEAEVDAAMKKA